MRYIYMILYDTVVEIDGEHMAFVGTMGLMGQLSAGEILEQLLHAKRFARL